MDEIDIGKLGNAVVMTIVKHPLSQVTTLIQLGHEPARPVLKPAGLFSKAKYVNPGVLTGLTSGGQRQGYMAVSGLNEFGNLTRGLPVSIAEVVASSLVQTVVTAPVKEALPEKKEDESYNQVLIDCARESVIKSAAIIVTNPLKVIMIRQIGALADGTHKSIGETVSEGGLFSGLVPRLAACVGSIFAVKSLMYLYKKHIQKEEHKDLPTEMVMEIGVSALLYPLKVVATVQSVAGTGSVLDVFPELGWLAVLSELKKAKDHKRGNSIYFDRPAVEPSSIQARPAAVQAPSPAVQAPVVVDIPPVVVQTPQPVEEQKE